jgi:hypothetical protein
MSPRPFLDPVDLLLTAVGVAGLTVAALFALTLLT